MVRLRLNYQDEEPLQFLQQSKCSHHIFAVILCITFGCCLNTFESLCPMMFVFHYLCLLEMWLDKNYSLIGSWGCCKHKTFRSFASAIFSCVSSLLLFSSVFLKGLRFCNGAEHESLKILMELNNCFPLSCHMQFLRFGFWWETN